MSEGSDYADGAFSLGDAIRVLGARARDSVRAGGPWWAGSVYAVGREVSIDGRGVEAQVLWLEVTPSVGRPKCVCGADAWVEGLCAKCFRARKGIGQNEYVLKRADGVWVVAASPPQLSPGDEVAGTRGLTGLTRDGIPWVEGAVSGRRWSQDAKTADVLDGRQYRNRQHADGSVTIEESQDGVDWAATHYVCGRCHSAWPAVVAAPGRCPQCPVPLEERVARIPADGRARLARAAQMVAALRRLEDEAAAIRESLVPEIPHSVIGFREWKFDAGSWQLEAAGIGRGAWSPGANRAYCGQTATPAPCEREGHHCGFNVYARPEFIGAHFTNRHPSAVSGAVEVWSDEGRFFVHAGVGFRAEFAKVVALVVDESWPRAKRSAVRAIAEDFEAATCRPEDLELAASEFGEPCPEHVLAWSRGEAEWPDQDAEAAVTYDRLVAEVAEMRSSITAFCRQAAGEHLTDAEVAQLVGLADDPR